MRSVENEREWQDAGREVMAEYLDKAGITLERIAGRIADMLEATRVTVVGQGKDAIPLETPHWDAVDKAIAHVARMRGLYAPERKQLEGGRPLVALNIGALPDVAQSEVRAALERAHAALVAAPDLDDEADA